MSINDTVDSIYKSFMYPEGIKAMAEAVKMIAEVNVCNIRATPPSCCDFNSLCIGESIAY